MTVQSINPATGVPVRAFEVLQKEDLDALIPAAHEAAIGWGGIAMSERATKVGQIAVVLRTRKDELATLITTEMGKPIRESRAEIEKCALVCDYYAMNGPGFLQDRRISTEAKKSYVRYDPLGLLLAVMPWNFPFWQLFRFAAPALTAGNGILLKHASNVFGCGEAIEDVIREAGIGENVFTNLTMSSELVSTVLSSKEVVAATLTGSEPAGKAVAECAGKHLKKTVLELGGSDPYLVLENADLELAVEKCAMSKLLNCGQVCIAAKRFIVVDKVHDAFVQGLRERMSQVVMGDPMQEDTELGPMARSDLRQELHEQVARCIRKGAKLLLGGELPSEEQAGFFYPPTLLTNVVPGMPAYNLEMFGPVAAVIKVADDKEAIEVANDSDFGLGAAVFTRDRIRGEMIAAQLQAGTVAINDFVKSDPRMPFGGVKRSGYGRELAREGMLEFVNTKSVLVN
ncbi:MAG: NAD-dependent succinate-semialdehyde dehydrogenase [Puniceicoccaceae bacterium]